MSSTKRSSDRHASDYYVTPISAILDFANAVVRYEPNIFKDKIVLDACAGGDTFHSMSYPEALKKIGVPEVNIDTLDIREDSLAQYKEDYLVWNPVRKYNLIISNPPFCLAMDFIQRSLELVEENGYVVMLLRLNYFGSKKRKSFWDKNMPKYSFVHHKRMSFTDDGQTDSIEYMHAVWQKGNSLPCTLFVV